jgi:hypothetical protein
VYGTLCARGATAGARTAAVDLRALPLGYQVRTSDSAEALDVTDLTNSLRSLMVRNMGIVRDRRRMLEAKRDVAFWCRYGLTREFDNRAGWELQNLLTAAFLVTAVERGLHGAFNAIGRLDAGVRARGVVAYSSGNHAQAVAYAAAKFGVPAWIVMPEETPGIKVAATRRHGAEVVLCGAGERERVADELVASTGGVLVPPFDHPDVIAGQGTIGLEMAAELPGVANVVVPVSGGGLASGIGTAIKALCPRARVIGATRHGGNRRGEAAWAQSREAHGHRGVTIAKIVKTVRSCQ